MENTIIAREHSFTNKGLKTATNRIIKATEQTAKSLMTIALTMVEIEEKELYKDDFSSVVEYGEKVFGYKKSAVYNMLKVGRQYLLPDTQKSIFADEDGTDFTFNQLSRFLPRPPPHRQRGRTYPPRIQRYLTMVRKLLHALALLLGVREAYIDSVDEGLVDFSGQGRDRYGR